MQTYRVDDMTCGHCASTITNAIHSVDTDAKVEIDLTQHLVRIESSKADLRNLSEAIVSAGYTPTSTDMRPATAATPKSGGCCGGRGASSCRN